MVRSECAITFWAHCGSAALSCASGDLNPCDTLPTAHPQCQPLKDRLTAGFIPLSMVRQGRSLSISCIPALLHPQELLHGSLSAPALLQGLRLLTSPLAFSAGDNHLLAQAEAPGSVAEKGSGCAGFSLSFLRERNGWK